MIKQSKTKKNLSKEDLPVSRSRIIRKGYALTKDDLESLAKLKDRCLDRKVVISDSHLIRTGIRALMNLSATELIKLSEKIEKMKTGRPVDD